MSFKIKNLFGAVTALLISLIISGCGGSDTPTPVTPLGDLVSINVAPASSIVIEGLNIQLTANGSYSNGQTVDITSSVNWASSDTAIAAVGASSGLVTALSQGSVTITATTTGSDGVTEIFGTADITVNAANLTSITLTPATATVVEGLTQAFVATGNYDNGSSVDLSAVVTWASSDDLIATVDTSGLATGIVAGSATITATSDSVSASADLTVNTASLTSITITPATAVVIEGLTQAQAFVATGNYDDGNSVDLSASV
ncbi:MAG: Ig-like domain-containing protein, partial [Gammaproteobacteria bacterium]|nr:Ig-like domain-containing protein [Gammaproteobacteria bacterium]